MNIIIWEEVKLANIKSSKKRIIVNNAKAERNKAKKSEIKTIVKKIEAAVAANDKAAAEKELLTATSLIQKAGVKHLYHKNTAARKISRLTKLVNSIA